MQDDGAVWIGDKYGPFSFDRGRCAVGHSGVRDSSQRAFRAVRQGLEGTFQSLRAKQVYNGGNKVNCELVNVDEPSRGEQKPLVAHDPDVFQIHLTQVLGGYAVSLRVLVHVRHPLAFLRSGKQLRPEPVATSVGAHPAIEVEPQPTGDWMGDYAVVLVDDEDVPFTSYQVASFLKRLSRPLMEIRSLYPPREVKPNSLRQDGALFNLPANVSKKIQS